MTGPANPGEPWQMVMEALSRIERRLDGFVTIPTHAADLRRIDDAVQNIAADLGLQRAEHAQQVAEVRAEFLRTLTEQRGSIESLSDALGKEADARRKGDEGDLATVRAEIKTEASDRKRDRQWLITAIVMVLGVVVAVAKVLWP